MPEDYDRQESFRRSRKQYHSQGDLYEPDRNPEIDYYTNYIQPRDTRRAAQRAEEYEYDDDQAVREKSREFLVGGLASQPKNLSLQVVFDVNHCCQKLLFFRYKKKHLIFLRSRSSMVRVLH